MLNRVEHKKSFITSGPGYPRCDIITTNRRHFNHDAIMTSYCRRCELMTSHQRQSDVNTTLYACWGAV